jgi:hypothetical protein
VAESLYLANLLVIPGIGFIVLAVLFLRIDRHTPPLAVAHLSQTFFASLWAGILLVVVNLGIVLLGGYRGPSVWMVIIIYFTICHSTLILVGMLGLAKAMAGKCYRFPLIGRGLPIECKGLT